MVGSWENAKEFLLDGWFLEWEMVGYWENAKEFLLGLRLFRHKIFSTVKYLQMQMILGKIIVFPVFDCILENSLKNILQCLEERKMKKRKFRNPLQSANPPLQSTDNQPQTTIIANPANPQTHHHSTSKLESHRAALNHKLIINCLVGSGSGAASIAERSDPSSSPTAPPSTTSPTTPPSTTSSPTHHQQPKTGTPTTNPSPDLVKKKTETQICSCFNGFSV